MGLAKPRASARAIRPFHASKPRRKDNDDRFKISWFEQSGDESTRRPISEAEFAEDDEAKELKAMLDKEEAELEEMRKEIPEDELKILEEAIAEAKLGEKFEEFLKEEEEREDEEGEEEEDDDHGIADLVNAAGVSTGRRKPAAIKQTVNIKKDSYSPLDIQLFLPKDKIPYLSQLNQALRRCSVETQSPAARELLWRWYTRCKQALPPFLALIPDPSWQLLEKSTQGADLIHKDRITRSRILLDDMKKANRKLDRPTRYRYLEYLLEEGRPKDAARQWMQDEVALRSDRTLALDFEDLGVRIFAEADNIEKAYEIALGRMFRNDGPKTRCLIHIIAYWTRLASKDSRQGLRKAWSFYDQFKKYMGPDMTLDDYDKIARIFLDVGRTDISLAVFKDYMLTTLPEGQAEQTYDKSDQTLKLMLSKTKSNEMMTGIALARIVLLPPKLNNKYFYASWMKRLIATGDNTGALAVVQLMYQRGVAPDAKHVNGIIGGLLRGGTVKDKEKAMLIAWSMVQQRLAFVAKRNSQRSRREDMPKKLAAPDWALEGNPSAAASIIIPTQVDYPLPSATIETFSLLLLFYARRSMLNHVDKVKIMLLQAEIPPNSFFMNHLLYSRLRRGDIDGVWNLYQKITRFVRRDLQTFACLWDTQKAHLNKVRFRERKFRQFIHPRELYYSMVEFLRNQTGHESKTTKESMTQDLYAQIASCFCFARDFEGLFVSLHAMKSHFGLYPDADTARAIAVAVSRINEPPAHDKRGRPRRRVRMVRPNVNLDRAARVLELLAKEREEQLGARGIQVGKVNNAFKMEEALYILGAMLRTVIRQMLPEGTNVQEWLEKVAWEMNVSGIYMGDHLDQPKVPDNFDVHMQEAEEDIRWGLDNGRKTALNKA